MGPHGSRASHRDHPVSGYNRLTNGERAELSKLPVWTTEADRRRALSYVDKPLRGALEAVRAISTGAPAPINLGVLVAAARYEEEGWMPDGCFEKWHRCESYYRERLDVPALVQWLGTHESTMQRKLQDLETSLMGQCHQQDKNLATVQHGLTLARKRLHAHHQKQILARLSLGDTQGAQEIAQRVPLGSARIAIDKILHEHLNTDDNTITSCPDIRGATAKSCAGSNPPVSTLSPEEREIVATWRRELRPLPHPSLESEHVHNARSAILDLLLEEPPPLSTADARELAERRALDTVRAEERRALDWLRQFMETISPRTPHPHATVLIKLATRLLGNAK